jgi:histidine triad (HIT) family protein
MKDMKEEECIFCKIGGGEIPSEFLYQDGTIFAIRDIRPKAPVHLLIIPFAHLEALTEEPESQIEIMHKLLVAATHLARQQNVADAGYRLVINQGPNSGQEVPHLHMHLLAGRPLRGMG